MAELNPDLVERFLRWQHEAERAGELEPTAMTVASVDKDGHPDARILLLKGFDQRGFVFYTNFESVKGGQLQANPVAALCWHWKTTEKQIRARGPISRVTDDEADGYFASRARRSQLGAWASKQSQPLREREQLLERLAAFSKQFDDQAVTRPPHWSGWRLRPTAIEFWQAGDNRLHQRDYYTWLDGVWQHQLLYP